METVLVALIAGPLSGLVAAAILGWQNRKTKAQDWEREDEVAARAAQAAQDLISANREVAKIARETATETFGKLEQIHTLVNSNMTAAMEDALASKLAHLVSLEQVLVMQKEANESLTDTLQKIREVKEDIARRRAELQDRLRQTKVAEAQVEQAEGGGLLAEWKEDEK